MSHYNVVQDRAGAEARSESNGLMISIGESKVSVAVKVAVHPWIQA